MTKARYSGTIAQKIQGMDDYTVRETIRQQLQEQLQKKNPSSVTMQTVQKTMIDELNKAVAQGQNTCENGIQIYSPLVYKTFQDKFVTKKDLSNRDALETVAANLKSFAQDHPGKTAEVVEFLQLKVWNDTRKALEAEAALSASTSSTTSAAPGVTSSSQSAATPTPIAVYPKTLAAKYEENLKILAGATKDFWLERKILDTPLMKAQEKLAQYERVFDEIDAPRAKLKTDGAATLERITQLLEQLKACQKTNENALSDVDKKLTPTGLEIAHFTAQQETLQTALTNMPKNPTADFKETRNAVNKAFAELALYDYRTRVAAKCNKLFAEMDVEVAKQTTALKLMQEDLKKAEADQKIATPENKPALDKKVKDLTASIAQYDAPGTRAETLKTMKKDLQTKQTEYDTSTNEEQQRALVAQITELKQKIAGYGETIIQGDEQRKEQQKKMAADLYPKVTDSPQDLNNKTKLVDRLLAQKFPSEFNHVYAELSKKPVAFKPGQMEALSKILETSKDAKPLIAPTIKAIQDCNDALAKIDELSRRTTSAHAMGTYAEEYKTAVHAAEEKMATVARRLNDSSVQPALTFAAKNAGKDETERKDNERKFNELMGALEATQAKLLEATLMLHKRLPKEKIPKTGWLSLTDQIKEKLGLIQCEPTTGRGVVTYQELNKETGQLETKYPKDKEGNNLDLSYIEAAQAVQKYNERHKDEPGFKRATIDPPRKDGRWTTHSNSKNKVTGTMELMNIMTEIQNARPKDEKKQTNTASVTASSVGAAAKKEETIPGGVGIAAGVPLNTHNNNPATSPTTPNPSDSLTT